MCFEYEHRTADGSEFTCIQTREVAEVIEQSIRRYEVTSESCVQGAAN